MLKDIFLEVFGAIGGNFYDDEALVIDIVGYLDLLFIILVCGAG